jgi:hypothetical protein
MLTLGVLRLSAARCSCHSRSAERHNGAREWVGSVGYGTASPPGRHLARAFRSRPSDACAKREPMLRPQGRWRTVGNVPYCGGFAGGAAGWPSRSPCTMRVLKRHPCGVFTRASSYRPAAKMAGGFTPTLMVNR